MTIERVELGSACTEEDRLALVEIVKELTRTVPKVSHSKEHDWKMGVGPWKVCQRCGVIASRCTVGWAYQDGLRELGTACPPCKKGESE